MSWPYGQVVDLVSFGIVEAQDLKRLEVTPAIVEISKPIIDYTFDRCAQVQLVPKGIKLNAEVDVLQQKGCLVDMEGMGTLVRCHTWSDDGIEIGRRTTNVHRHEGARDERSNRVGGTWNSVRHG